MTITVDKPCLLMLRDMGEERTELCVSDPTQKLAHVTVTASIRLGGENCEWNAARSYTEVFIHLPDGGDAGRSVVRMLQREQ